VDKYSDYLVIQSHALVADVWLPLVIDALQEVMEPRGILLRNDSTLRNLENLPQEVRCVRGEVPKIILIQQDSVKFMVDPWKGHKTGFYLDQADNRLALRRYVSGAKVLDCFCYTGGFSVFSALAGARQVIGIDSSADALVLAQENARTNDVSSRCQFINSDVFDYLQSNPEAFDVVILDPPSFTRSKRQLKTALKGYVKLNILSLDRVSEGGILVSASCSHHISSSLFRECLVMASMKAQTDLLLLEWGSQAPDHPVHLSMPETEYLHCALSMVRRRHV